MMQSVTIFNYKRIYPFHCVINMAALHLAVLAVMLGCISARSFTIDFKNNQFLKDGQPFRYVSGSIHYARVPSALWGDRLKKMRAAGLNALQTYVPWNFHEISPGEYDFSGDRDLFQFLKVAQENDLLVIFRAGPYMCGEWEFGGFPSWLLKNENIVLRSNDSIYLSYVDTWMTLLLSKVKPYLYANGGPIIMVQVENEYGSYGCNHDYIKHLYNLFRSVLGDEVILFSTDGCSSSLVSCGSLPELFSTVDFGTGSNPAACFEQMRKEQPNGPFVNSEFYTGWLDHWGEHHETVDPQKVATALDRILDYNGSSVNMYMFEGGTNFGFMNGANAAIAQNYEPQPTSYDYDAPLTEAGDPGKKFTLIREVISKYLPLPPGPVPPASSKTAYGKVEMKEYAWLFDTPNLVTKTVVADNPLTFEELDQSYGFVLYKAKQSLRMFAKDGPFNKSFNITVNGVHDRAYIFVDEELHGILQRRNTSKENMSISVTVQTSAKGQLSILVENMGRINYGHLLADRKGILYNVLLDGVPMREWTSQSVPMNMSFPDDIFKPLPSSGALPSSAILFRGLLPAFPKGSTANDTFLLLDGWSKGVAFINGFNIGRYWPVEPPQVTLYVPSSVLRSDGTANEIVVFEQDKSPCQPPLYDNCLVSFVDAPVFD